LYAGLKPIKKVLTEGAAKTLIKANTKTLNIFTERSLIHYFKDKVFSITNKKRGNISAAPPKPQSTKRFKYS
jgi:hypothetical protein